MQGEIYAALAKVMGTVGVVGKAKKNVQQGYQFRGIDDVVAHVQQVMADCGVICVPRVVERERENVPTKSGGVMASVRLMVEHTFYAKDGSSVVCTTLGEAMDSGDKASNKAMSAALKYALTETLLIPTYEADRDTEESSPVMAAPAAKATLAPVPAPTPAPKVHRMRIEDAPVESFGELRLAIERASSVGALTMVGAKIAALKDDEKELLRPIYNARAAALGKAGAR